MLSAMVRRSLTVALVALLAALGVAGPAAAKAKPKPSKTVAGVATLRIGWVYTDEQYGGDHEGRLNVNWKSCIKAGGSYVDFPKGSHVLPFRDVPGNTVGSRMAVAHGHFVSEPYIGADAKPGNATITLSCKKQNGHLLGTGKLKVKFVRVPITFDPGDIPLTLTLPYLVDGQTTDSYSAVSVPACSAPGIKTVQLTSKAFAADPNTGSRTVTLTRPDPQNGQDPGFKGPITGAPDVPPGQYPIDVTCGSGAIGTGTIELHEPGL